MRGITSKVQLQAFEYLVNGDAAQSRAAITSMLDTLKRTNFGTKNDLSRASGSMLMVGGPGKEFWVFCENYPNAATTRPDPCNERGAWRVEVTPKKAAKEDCFLNVMQVMDNTCTPLPVKRIEADSGVLYFTAEPGKYSLTR